MKIKLHSIFVNNQERALKFYTDVLGFVKKTDLNTGNGRWLTVVSPDDPNGVELVIEPGDNQAAKAFMESIHKQGIPHTAFEVTDIVREYERLKIIGVIFSQAPTKAGPVTTAVFDDTCGNLIQIYQA